MDFFHDVDALGRVTAYAYDAASRLTSLTDPVGNAASWTYDDAGRVLTETDPLGKVTTHAHDLVGNPAQTTDRMGRVARYAYDDDRLPAGGGAAVDSIAYDYDVRGRLTRIVQSGTGVADKRVDLARDGDGRRTTKIQGGSSSPARSIRLDPRAAATSGRSGSARGGGRPSRP